MSADPDARKLRKRGGSSIVRSHREMDGEKQKRKAVAGAVRGIGEKR